MSVTKVGDRWQADVRPGGRFGTRIRKRFNTRREAERFERFVRDQHESRKPWQPPEKDRRRLSELVEQWFHLHGCNLKDGEPRRRILLDVAKRLRNPIGSQLQPAVVIAYRNERVQGGLSVTTANRQLSYLKSVYNELERIGQGVGNPIARVRPIKQDERELSYLTHAQICALLDELARGRNKDALLVAKLCLATGARWSEAQGLKVEDVLGDRVRYSGTKSGKIRVVPVARELLEEITNRRRSWRLFNPCYCAFRHAVKRAGIELPKGQMAHVLRHTFASHFVMRGGNILVLQKILGHSDVKVTMRYAHLAPEHLEAALRLNPLSMQE